jgi:hypothetical protein
MKDAKRTGLTVIVGVLALLIFTLGSWVWLYGTAEIRGRVGAEVKLESADSRIANYDHFYDLCAAVQGYEHALLSQRSALAAGISADRAYTNMAGITAQRARAIAQYNADANKSYTKARFLGDTLPRRLDVNLENTQCN